VKDNLGTFIDWIVWLFNYVLGFFQKPTSVSATK